MSKKLDNKKIAIIVAHEFEDIELLYPIIRLSEEGAEIIVIPLKDGLHTRPMLEDKPVTGRFGHTLPLAIMKEGKLYTIQGLDQISVESVDCLLFPGGYSPDSLRLNEKVLTLVKDFHRKGKLLSAICHGPLIFISAGIISGKHSTGYAAVRDDLRNAGAKYIDTPAVRDGNIITGRVPDDLTEFCRLIIEYLAE